MYRIIKYLISGFSAAAVNLGFLYLFTEWLHIWYVTSATLAFILGVLVSFVLQKFWTFDNHEVRRMHIQTGKFFIVALGNLALNTLGIYVMVDYLHIWYLLAEFVILGLLAVGSFFIYRSFVFTADKISD